MRCHQSTCKRLSERLRERVGVQSGVPTIGERCTVVKVPAMLIGRAALRARLGVRPRLPGGEWYLHLYPGSGQRVCGGFGFQRRLGVRSGYRRDGKGCAAVTVPAHGFLQRGGDDWDCDRSFRKQADACVPGKYPRALTWTGRVMAGNASADSGGKARFASRWSFPRAPISPIPAMTGLAWTAFAGKAKRASLTD